jgi:ATP-dependent DNA helicase RecQ
MNVLNETHTTPASTSSFNARFAATAIFKTIALLERQYSTDYLDHILRGETRFGFRSESHKQLETFGLLSKFWRSKLTALFDVLIEDGFIYVKDAQYGNLALTDLAKAYLDNPHDLFVNNNRLRLTPKDSILFKELRMLRKQLSEEAGIMPYVIFNNYALKELVKNKPEDIASLKEVPGLSHAQADRYGQSILAKIKYVTDNAWKLVLLQKALYPSYQEVKDLLLEGKNIEEIALAKGWGEETIVRSVETLHLAGEIDATAWVESQVEAKALNKGIQYFQQVEDNRLKAAYETLDLDYRTLRMCRMYVSDVISVEEEEVIKTFFNSKKKLRYL